MYVSDISTLLSNAMPTAPDEFVIGGFYAPGDGGGGTFIWGASASPFAQDNGIIFFHPTDPTGANGYFQRIYSGPINVRWFGAIMELPDGTIQNTDVTLFVHAARDSKAFADNGTLYFPKGLYVGCFEIWMVYSGGVIVNEINIIGDGQGTILKSNGTHVDGPGPGYNLPVLYLGVRNPHWRYTRVSNLQIDGAFSPAFPKFSDGVVFENPGTPWGTESAGRWVLERVYFTNCNRGVYKVSGNIGNHFIDCNWAGNNYGVFAEGLPEKMHNGCDRYSGGEFSGHTGAAIRYSDSGAGGQIIIDGVVMEYNDGWGITIEYDGDGRMTYDAICIRNVWFEDNGSDGSGGDMKFMGVRSVRIDDSLIQDMELVGSSVNLYNCRFEGGWAPGEENNSIKVDNASSLVAYEHRYLGPPHDKIFVNSISYDATNEIGYKNWSNPSTPASPAPWLPTSVWGPLRAVRISLKADIVVTNQFEMASETWDDFGTSNPLLTSNWDSPHVLGSGSNELSMPGGTDVWSKNVVGTISTPGYYVWSIHTYLEEVDEDNMSQVWGEIIYEWLPGPIRLGLVYFKYRNWACSYGMKWFDPGGESLNFKLAFHNASGTDARFCITDYQIVKFDTLAAANSFVNSREFAQWVGEGGDQG